MAEEQVTQEAVETAPVDDVSRETSDVPIPERPEHIPEKFWDADTGEVKLDDLAKSYINLEKFSTGKKDEMRDQLLTELQAEATEGLPEDPSGYKLPPLVEGITEEMVEENPLTGWWRDHCHDLGMPEEVFQTGVEKYVDMMVGGQPNLEAEAEKLGENARERLDAVTAFAQSTFPPEEFEVISATLGQSALGVQALERMQDAMRSSISRSEQVAQPDRALSVDDVKNMMKDPKYFDPRYRDASFVKRVDDMWARLNATGQI
jgi:hypothetical protein